MTALNAKQEAIKKAYGEYWETVKDKITDDGFAPYVLLENSIGIMFQFRTFIIADCNPEIHVRPISLQGIKNNNGWIRIESEADLPKQGMHHSILLDSECINGYRNYDITVFYEVNSRFRKKEISHYQPIEEPLKPIY